ncbi:hypothetical protein IWZ03DRAFT_63293 [Phyllosticta citriasiana]|uniref:Tachykinin family protein n=2 Tax=Phyllosticta citriasiana TaxID=595635 RepID=A0ABR1KBI6_9PEZI
MSGPSKAHSTTPQSAMSSTTTMELPQWPAPAAPDPFPDATSSRPSSRSSTEDGGMFKFVTATKPEEFKDRDLMRGVRSHVMYQVVEHRNQKQTTGSDARISSTPRKTRGGSSGSAASASTSMTPTARPSGSSSNPKNPETISNRDAALEIFAKYQRPRSATASQASGTPRSEGTPEGSSPESARSVAARPRLKRPRTIPRSAIEQRRDEAVDEQVLVQAPEFGRVHMNPLFKAAQPGSFSSLRSDAQAGLPLLSNFFSPYDPFYTLPQPSDPRINVEQVKWYCHNYFGTKAMARAWLPQMIGSRESFLSTLGISTAHQDAIEGRSEPSFMTSLVNTEAIRLINDALADRWTRIRDSTIMSVCQLLASRVVTADNNELQRHENGLRELIVERGGLESLGVSGDLASVACAMAYTSAIIRESQPDAFFLSHRPERKVYDNNTVLPESPLFYPRSGFVTLSRSKSCIKPLLSLIEKLKALTEACVSLPAHTSTWDLADYRRSILLHIQALPYAENLTPAQLVGSPPTPSSSPSSSSTHHQSSPPAHHLARYEAARLAAKLYAYALAHRVPLSAAAAAHEGILAQLVAALKLSHCPYSDCWDDMTGVLYWITLVGAAAAAAERSANVAGMGADGTRRHERERRWLAALNIRCAIVLAFEHRAALVGSLRTMLDALAGCGSVSSSLSNSSLFNGTVQSLDDDALFLV